MQSTNFTYGTDQRNATRPSVGSSTPSADTLADKVGGVLQQGKEAIQSSASEAGGDMTEQMAQMRRDMAKMQETIAKFASEAGGQAAKTAQGVGSVVVDEVGAAATQMVDAGAKMAASATEQAKTFASELETMARRNPFGTLAGTLVVGVVLGMMSRRG
jgi:ElaB/YqjD/DUF883 family membrane-anchored ribosome-binding protein